MATRDCHFLGEVFTMKHKFHKKASRHPGLKSSVVTKAKPAIIHNPELIPREKIANPLKTPEQREQYSKLIADLKKKYLQPKPKSYNAQGFAKESVWLDVLDPKFLDKFQEVFDEHITGWAGKSFKKQKTEAELNMEWRVRLREKQAKEKQPTRQAQGTSKPSGHDSGEDGDTITSSHSKTHEPQRPIGHHKHVASTKPMGFVGVPSAPSQGKMALSSQIGASKAQPHISVETGPKGSKNSLDVTAQQKAIEMYWLLKQKKKLQEKQQQQHRR